MLSLLECAVARIACNICVDSARFRQLEEGLERIPTLKSTSSGLLMNGFGYCYALVVVVGSDINLQLCLMSYSFCGGCSSCVRRKSASIDKRGLK